ncbi:MAG: hydantoinase/oxoprolinase family protein [Thermomicrobiales bacterium]
MTQPRYHLGIDIGGTFTDLSLRDCQTGQITGLKTPTVPGDPARGVANGLALLAERGVSAAQIEYFVHGTTIGVNAIIQRTGAPVALLVTAGFRDVLEMARLRLPTPWDFYAQRPRPLIPREWVVPVEQRLTADGAVVQPLTEEEIDRVVVAVTALPVRGVAICLLHSYQNPEHELTLKAALHAAAPELFVSASAEVWPQIREYERSLVTAMNAYVRPAMASYLQALEGTLRAAAMAARPYLTRSNGGIMTTTAAKDNPVQTLLSGPASGVIGARGVARQAGFSDAITFDMGGTSADIALITGGEVEFSREAQVGDFPLFLPVVGVSSIGAGGGSIAWIDGAGVLKVGPRSAGADPGPACYGLGGEDATLSDAFLLCGYLNPGRFAGKAQLDIAAAERAVSRLAAPLGRSVPETASAIVRVALATMYAEFSAVLERRGIDPRDFTLVAFGGAGPVVACLLAAEVNMRRVLVPPSPGTLCALGALHADVMSDFIRTVHWRLDRPPGEGVQRAMFELHRQGAAWLAQEAPATVGIVFRWSADMRYVGQSYEIETPVERAWLDDGDAAAIAASFHATHQAIFNHADPEAPVEMVNLRVRAAGRLHDLPPVESDLLATGDAVSHGERTIDVGGVQQRATLLDRQHLNPGHHFAGPAVVEQPDSTVVIPTGWDGSVDRHGNLILERSANG